MIDRVLLVGPSTALDLELLRGNEKTTPGGSPIPQEPLLALLPGQAGWALRCPNRDKDPIRQISWHLPPMSGSSLMRPLTNR
jgi:hypothetical protein